LVLGLFGDVTAGFGVATTVEPSSDGTLAGGVIGDFLHDGGLDIRGLRSSSPGAIVFDFDNGTAYVERSPNASRSTGSVTDIFSAQPAGADLNRDGDLDVVYDDTAGADGVTTQFGDGMAGFSLEPQVENGDDVNTALEAQFVLVADFAPGSGPDLAMLSLEAPTNGTLVVAPNNGTGGFTSQASIGVTLPPSLDNPYKGVVGHFNDDGYVDLAYIRLDPVGNRSEVVFLFGDPSAATLFQPAPAAPQVSAPGVQFTDLAVGDFDRDGVDDVVLVAESQWTLITPKPDSGLFLASDEQGTGNRPLSLAVADFNLDGALDFAVGNTVLSGPNPIGEVRVFLGDGAGSFSALGSPIALPLADLDGDVLVLKAADVDGDGRPDIVAMQGSRFHVLRNQ
jgi:hypothetical protein